MSRSRNIKPGFFKNDLLAELPFEYRLLFQGLWCEADRDGKLEDRPKRIKGDVFPYDDVDVNDGLNRLHMAGFIHRYEVDGKRYIKVMAFAKHQNPHKKEALSCIPDPEPVKPGASPVLASEIPERAGLIPDSPFLIPDSLQKPCVPPAAAPVVVDLFEFAWAAYPKRAGTNSKGDAKKHWNARIAEGVPPEELIDGVKRYARFARGTGKERTETVMQAQRFFGTGRHYEADWELPLPPAPVMKAPGKTMQAIMMLEGMKNGNVDSAGDYEGISATAMPWFGAPAGSGNAPGNGHGLANGFVPQPGLGASIGRAALPGSLPPDDGYPD